MCGQVLLLFSCLICTMTMCQPECKNYTRKCFQAGKPKDPHHSPDLTHFPHFVSVRFADFLPHCFLNSISSRSINLNVQWDPNRCRTMLLPVMRDVLWFFIIVRFGSFWCLPPVKWAKVQTENKRTDRVELNKVFCSVNASSYSACLCVFLRGWAEVRRLTDTQVWPLSTIWLTVDLTCGGQNR